MNPRGPSPGAHGHGGSSMIPDAFGSSVDILLTTAHLADSASILHREFSLVRGSFGGACATLSTPAQWQTEWAA